MRQMQGEMRHDGKVIVRPFKQMKTQVVWQE